MIFFNFFFTSAVLIFYPNITGPNLLWFLLPWSFSHIVLKLKSACDYQTKITISLLISIPCSLICPFLPSSYPLNVTTSPYVLSSFLSLFVIPIFYQILTFLLSAAQRNVVLNLVLLPYFGALALFFSCFINPRFKLFSKVPLG